MRLSTLRGTDGVADENARANSREIEVYGELGLLLTRGEGVRDHHGASDNGSLMVHTGT
jgi:hypothetical protein